MIPFSAARDVSPFLTRMTNIILDDYSKTPLILYHSGSIQLFTWYLDRGQRRYRFRLGIRSNSLIIRNSLKYRPRKHVDGYLGRSRNNSNASTRSLPPTLLSRSPNYSALNETSSSSSEFSKTHLPLTVLPPLYPPSYYL